MEYIYLNIIIKSDNTDNKISDKYIKFRDR